MSKTMSLALKKHRDIDTPKEIIEKLVKQEPILYSSGYRELHVAWKPDFLLLYKIHENELILQRVGSHDELF